MNKSLVKSVFLALFLTSLTALNAHAGKFDDFKDSPEGKYPAGLVDHGAQLPNSFDAKTETIDAFGTRTPAKAVALYKDKGVWAIGLNHTKKLLKKMKISYTTLNARDIQAGKLDSKKFSMIVMPGGKSWIYLDDLKETGAKAIRDFVAGGGGYLGTCAGAFFATARRKDSNRNDIPYGIGLLEGTAYDGTSLGTAPFRSGSIDITYHLKNFKPNFKVLLLGGPALLYTAEEAAAKNIQELATFPGFNKPAMITFNYGQSRVSLSGPHGEVDENRLVKTPKAWKDPDSEWPILKQVISWLRKEGAHPTLAPALN